MNLTVIGTGYVGLVSGTCLADVGNHVLCLDVDQRKIESLLNGVIPIFEPGLEDMVKRNVAAGRLKFTTDVAAATAFGQIQFIAVGTPRRRWFRRSQICSRSGPFYRPKYDGCKDRGRQIHRAGRHRRSGAQDYR